MGQTARKLTMGQCLRLRAEHAAVITELGLKRVEVLQARQRWESLRATRTANERASAALPRMAKSTLFQARQRERLDHEERARHDLARLEIELESLETEAEHSETVLAEVRACMSAILASDQEKDPDMERLIAKYLEEAARAPDSNRTTTALATKNGDRARYNRSNYCDPRESIERRHRPWTK